MHTDKELRFSPGPIIHRSTATRQPQTHSQVGSLTGCGDENGDWLSQFTWAAVTGVTLG